MLRVEALNKEFRNEHGEQVRAARDITFEVPKGEMFTLLGPSGCGKTTTLRSIAGLEKPSSGEISLEGYPVYSSERGIFVPPNRRGFGMVFQSYAIWPHMTVYQNVAFALEVERKHSKSEIRKRVMEVLEVVDLAALEARKATKMSGGQQQRLALARALVKKPQLLLLDEPLSNLDAKLRERMRFEIKRLQRELGLTTIYVTHDQSEALALSHKIAVMKDGQIVQIGPPKEIYSRPGSRFVADFVGTTNFLESNAAEPCAKDGHYRLTTPCGELVVQSAQPLGRGESVTVALRPENIHIASSRPDHVNVWQGIVDTRVFLGDFQDLQIKVGAAILQARAHPSLDLDSGSSVFLHVEPNQCTIIVN